MDGTAPALHAHRQLGDTADMGVGEEEEATAGPSCPLVCAKVLMSPSQAPSKGAHRWAAVPRLVQLMDQDLFCDS